VGRSEALSQGSLSSNTPTSSVSTCRRAGRLCAAIHVGRCSTSSPAQNTGRTSSRNTALASSTGARHPKKTYSYPRYFFSNRSRDIQGIFCDACDRLGVAWRQDGPWNVSVARREAVAILDRHVGPKR